MTKGSAIIVLAGAAALGAAAGLLEQYNDRIRRLEARPYDTAPPSTTGEFMELRRKLARDTARDFVEVLKEEGLVIAPEPPAGDDAA